MRRINLIKSILLVVFPLLSMAVPAAAHPNTVPCTPYTPPPFACTRTFNKGDKLLIREGIPFVWVRSVPGPSGYILRTVWPSSVPRLEIVSGSTIWDGYQSWLNVAPISNLAADGWVEQASLVAVAPAGPPRANWDVPMPAHLKPPVPFAWLRIRPSSYAPPLLLTILPGTPFTLNAWSAPVFDGVQWWWNVRALGADGWLEQNSILPDNIKLPMPVKQ